MTNAKGRPVTLDGAEVKRLRDEGATWLQVAIRLQCSINGARKAMDRQMVAGWKPSTAWEEPLPEVQDA